MTQERRITLGNYDFCAEIHYLMAIVASIREEYKNTILLFSVLYRLVVKVGWKITRNKYIQNRISQSHMLHIST